jgi:hypothetical protein
MNEIESKSSRLGRVCLSACLASVVSVACSDDGASIVAGAGAPGRAGSPAGAAGAGGEPAATQPGHVYAQLVVIRTEESAVSYVVLSDTLDASNFSLDDAREFPDFVDIAAVGGQLLVGNTNEPRITRYGISPSLEWEEGDSLSFANQGMESAGFDGMWFADDHTAYAVVEQNVKRVVWDPTAFEIKGVMQDSNLTLARDGYDLWFSQNRDSSSFRWNGPVLRPFSYYDADDLSGPISQIAAYDPVTHQEIAAFDAPCPNLEVSSRDEAGNTYFSTWFYNPTAALYGTGPAPCVVRVKPDLTLDQAWTTDLTQMTGGKYVKVFRYLRDGKAIGTVLDNEQLQLDPATGYDEDMDTEIWQADHWRLWLFDLESGQARPIEGLGAVGATFKWATLGDRTFVFQRYADSARTKVLEIDAAGNTTEHLDTEGWFYE